MSMLSPAILILPLLHSASVLSFSTHSKFFNLKRPFSATNVRAVHDSSSLQMLEFRIQHSKPIPFFFKAIDFYHSCHHQQYVGRHRLACPALLARQQDFDDDDDDDDVEITTYLTCPKCMSDHFILREVLGEGRCAAFMQQIGRAASNAYARSSVP